MAALSPTSRWQLPNRRDKQTGEMKEQTEWHRVVLFGKLAEVAGEYLRKGSQVYIEGQLRTRKWTDQSGQDKYTTEVVVNVGGTMQMLGGRQGGGAPAGGGQQQGGWGQPQQPQGGNQFSGGAQSVRSSRPRQRLPTNRRWTSTTTSRSKACLRRTVCAVEQKAPVSPGLFFVIPAPSFQDGI